MKLKVTTLLPRLQQFRLIHLDKWCHLDLHGVPAVIAEASSRPFAILHPTPGPKVDRLRHVEPMVEALVVCKGEDHHRLPLLLHQPCYLDSIGLQQLRLDDDALVTKKIVTQCCLSREKLTCQRLEPVFDFALQTF